MAGRAWLLPPVSPIQSLIGYLLARITLLGLFPKELLFAQPDLGFQFCNGRQVLCFPFQNLLVHLPPVGALTDSLAILDQERAFLT